MTKEFFKKYLKLVKKYVLQFHLHLFLGKLKLKQGDLFIVKDEYLNRAIEFENLNNSLTFKFNSQILKLYLEYQPHKEDTEINLSDPSNHVKYFFVFNE